jgi:hypothetical protein
MAFKFGCINNDCFFGNISQPVKLLGIDLYSGEEKLEGV